VQCYSRLMGEKIWISQVFFFFLSGIKGSKWVSRTWNMMKWSSKIIKNRWKCWKNENFLQWDRCLSTRAMAVQLNLDKETVKKAWTLAQRLGSPPWQCSSSQGALCQAVSGPKIYYWNITLNLFPWFDSKWLVVISKNKACLKGWRFQDTEDIQNMWVRQWKLFHNRGSKSFTNSWGIS